MTYAEAENSCIGQPGGKRPMQPVDSDWIPAESSLIQSASRNFRSVPIG